MRGLIYLSLIQRVRRESTRMAAYIRKEPAIMLLCSGFIVIVGALACLWFPHQLNPDATAYFTIAEKYAHFNILEALNSYWGPLFSWLLVPFVWLGVGLDAAARGLLVMAAAATLLVMYRFWRARGLSQLAGTSMCLVAASVFAGWILLGATSPDMIFTFLVALLAVRLDRFLATPTTRNSVWLGCVGALLYFAKGFGLYLFLAVLAGLTLWQWARVGRTKTIRRIAPLVLSFAVLVVPFMIALSLKYHQPTTNSTGAYVHRVFGPLAQSRHPMLTAGPFAPPNDTATTVWEDPTLMMPLMPDWSPLQSRANLSYFWHKIILNNLTITITALSDMGALCVTAVLLLVMGCLNRGPGRTFRREYIVLTLLSLTMVGGYTLVLTEPRYLWPVIVLALMGTGLWVARLEEKQLLSGAQIVLASILIAGFYILPLPAKLHDSRESAQSLYAQSQSLRPILTPHTRVIADNFMEYNVCYYLQLHCYAVMRTPVPGEEDAYYEQLKAVGIAYFIDYHTRDADPRLHAFIEQHFVAVDTPATTGLTLYRLR